MLKISKREYEALRKKDPKNVRKTKRTFFRIEQTTYIPRTRINQIFTYPNYQATR